MPAAEIEYRGARSGLIADADFRLAAMSVYACGYAIRKTDLGHDGVSSDVYGKRWYQTEEGQEYLRQVSYAISSWISWLCIILGSAALTEPYRVASILLGTDRGCSGTSRRSCRSMQRRTKPAMT